MEALHGSEKGDQDESGSVPLKSNNDKKECLGLLSTVFTAFPYPVRVHVDSYTQPCAEDLVHKRMKVRQESQDS